MRQMMPLTHSMVGLPRRGVAAVLLAAWLLAAGLLGTDPPAAAQSVTTFVSNTAQYDGTVAASVQATAFTTGARTYTLSSVGVYTAAQSGPPPPPRRSRFTGTTGAIRAPCWTPMINPSALTVDGVSIFTAPANTMLSASTTYWVVTSNSANTPTERGFRVGISRQRGKGQRCGTGMEHRRRVFQDRRHEHGCHILDCRPLSHPLPDPGNRVQQQRPDGGEHDSGPGGGGGHDVQL